METPRSEEDVEELPERIVDAMLHVLSHFGGRVDSEVLVSVMRQAGVSREEFVAAWARATDAGLVVELGDTTHLASAGRHLLACSAPDLAALARRAS